ncbi:D-alanyl-D-alanine carboxypeptidase/D-alanyl-D-alanine-endopeptidase [Tabrizicola sp. J26]|uniref:D-alanyl-D-alanine carboxypeptidase/D-alanyl-D-alanine endopeptidase n=1 Tax=Alitabrizicola rongguiensis TaxID=2909234 RepID=UPI001F2FF3AD|nr:D-alanyl-D-alanine carboxypeptidase/D-alanyl-D-alanine-endopeptidase [Tabrizicola rongguiensis]MCF1707346.1 D-alanyl-D-alanine carboxypeptidase/D-alanyl-D-alanine-endopeptidase [Tabrizicola rongguiensis]
MTKTDSDVSRRWLLGALMAGVAVPALAEAPTTSVRPVPRPVPGGTVGAPAVLTKPVAAAADDIIQAARLGGQVAYLCVDPTTGETIDARNPDLVLPPASTAKAITTLYALDRLGGAHQFETRVLATGPVAGGIVQGDLVLSGTGDPTLSTDMLAAMAATLSSKGVRGVTGRFLVDDGALPNLPLIDPEQPDYVGYNPAISGLNLNYNRVHFEWKRKGNGWSLAMDARSDRFVPPVQMAQMKVVNRDKPLFTFDQKGGIDSWTVAATALGNSGSRWLPVRQPGAYAGDVFRALCKSQGLTLPEPREVRGAPSGTILVRQSSEQLTSVIRSMLKYSTNLTAEVLGLSSSGPEAGTLRESGRRMSGWANAKFGRSGSFVDHSGLGPDSRVAPADMVAALAAPSGGQLVGLMKPFKLRGLEGQPAKGTKDPALTVQAKTGTLNFASGLVGFVQTPAGRRLAFAVYSADVARRDALPLALREDPPGGSAWASRSRVMESQLIERWSVLSA